MGGKLQAQEVGIASFYHDYFHGRKTASGITFDNHKMYAAHKSLPFGTVLRVTNPDTEKSVIVEVVDRGPYVRGRVLDLSYAAAKELGFIRKGITDVIYEILPEDSGTDTVTPYVLNPDAFLTLQFPDSNIYNEFGVKVGVFENTETVLEKARELSDEYDFPVMMENFALNGRTMYRLFLGRFREEDEAVTLFSAISKHYPESSVVQFSAMK